MAKESKVAIIPLGDGASGNVSSVLANPTARKILNLISDEPLSAMKIAYKTDIAINTAQYNLENLEKAGLVEVERVEKSRKGRDMKIYGPTNKIIAIVPKGMDERSIANALRGLLPLFLLAIVLSVGVELAFQSPATTYPGEPLLYGELANIPELSMQKSVMPPAATDDATRAVMATGDGGDVEEAIAFEVDDGDAWEANTLDVPGPQTKDTLTLQDDALSVGYHPGLWMMLGSIIVILCLALIMSRVGRQ